MARISEVHIGARFGKLTVIGERTKDRQSRVLVRCDCGNDKSVYVHHLGVCTHSCGCEALKKTANLNRSHGMSRTPEYHTWERMIQRCTNPNNPGWADYGGRGITVHPAFRSDFMAFYVEVGQRPGKGYSLDRIDNDRGYEPGNLRWATQHEQNLNQRRNRVCRRGHQIEGANELITPSGERRCRECRQRASREQAARRRGTVRVSTEGGVQ